MRIDSGLNNYLYQSRIQTRDDDADEKAAQDQNAQGRPRVASNPASSSTLLSTQLASALWTVEGARKTASGPAAAEDKRATSPAQLVEAYYLAHGFEDDDIR